MLVRRLFERLGGFLDVVDSLGPMPLVIVIRRVEQGHGLMQFFQDNRDRSRSRVLCLFVGFGKRRRGEQPHDKCSESEVTHRRSPLPRQDLGWGGWVNSHPTL